MANKFYKEKLFEPIIDRLKVKGSPVKPRVIMKSLGFTNKMIKAYINDEQNLQRERPETSGHNKFRNKPMPKEFEVRGN